MVPEKIFFQQILITNKISKLATSIWVKDLSKVAPGRVRLGNLGLGKIWSSINYKYSHYVYIFSQGPLKLVSALIFSIPISIQSV